MLQQMYLLTLLRQLSLRLTLNFSSERRESHLYSRLSSYAWYVWPARLRFQFKIQFTRRAIRNFSNIEKSQRLNPSDNYAMREKFNPRFSSQFHTPGASLPRAKKKWKRYEGALTSRNHKNYTRHILHLYFSQSKEEGRDAAGVLVGKQKGNRCGWSSRKL